MMIINYDNLIKNAISKNEVVQLLCGSGGYEIQNSEFVQDVFPTNIMSVLVNCFYKQKDNVFNICEIFSNALECMIQNNAKEAYIAILYFDACIFKEETHSASFCINKEKFAKKLKVAINTYTKELNSPITFDNGMTKKFPMKNIENFNKSYISKYNFSIL